jgi:hypothetical protein
VDLDALPAVPGTPQNGRTADVGDLLDYVEFDQAAARAWSPSAASSWGDVSRVFFEVLIGGLLPSVMYPLVALAW